MITRKSLFSIVIVGAAGYFLYSLLIGNLDANGRQDKKFYSSSYGKKAMEYNTDGLYKFQGPIVTHLKSGLTWMRCPLGKTYAANRCEGETRLYSSRRADELAESHSVAGFSDWRLPTLEEMISILELDRPRRKRAGGYSLNPKAFPDTKTDYSVKSYFGFWLASGTHTRQRSGVDLRSMGKHVSNSDVTFYDLPKFGVYLVRGRNNNEEKL